MGGLVQGRFKAVQTETDEQLLHTSRYIHLNPLVSEIIPDLKNYKWSSFLDYTENKGLICTKNTLFSFFSTPDKYEEFMMDQADYAKKLESLKHLNLD